MVSQARGIGGVPVDLYDAWGNPENAAEYRAVARGGRIPLFLFAPAPLRRSRVKLANWKRH